MESRAHRRRAISPGTCARQLPALIRHALLVQYKRMHQQCSTLQQLCKIHEHVHIGLLPCMSQFCHTCTCAVFVQLTVTSPQAAGIATLVRRVPSTPRMSLPLAWRWGQAMTSRCSHRRAPSLQPLALALEGHSGGLRKEAAASRRIPGVFQDRWWGCGG